MVYDSVSSSHLPTSGTRSNECRCEDAAVAKFVSKLSGPPRDGIDLQIEIARARFDDRSEPNKPRPITCEHVPRRFATAA